MKHATAATIETNQIKVKVRPNLGRQKKNKLKDINLNRKPDKFDLGAEKTIKVI